MKAAIVFYSFSGNTKKACEFLKEKFSAGANQIEIIELKLKEEEKSFFAQGKAARSRQIPELTNTDFDLGRFDFIVFSSPVWAFTFTPALRSFLQKCAGLENKKTAVFLTCGAAIASGMALKDLKNTVVEKGAEVIFSAYITGHKTNDKAYLKKSFAKLTALIAK